MIFDPLYIMLAIPGLLLGLYATWKTKSTFKRYHQYAASSRMTGAQAARRLLDREGLQAVQVEPVQGFLSDHYDPRSRTLRLSPDVYQSPSLAAIGVACHEAGHAIQHATQYAPLQLRSALVPVTQFGSNMVYFIFFIGLLMNQPLLVNGAILLFTAVVLFTLVTLPVEWDASARAKRLMVAAGIVSEQERADAGRVLNGAFLTYVSALVSSLLTLLYFIMRARR